MYVRVCVFNLERENSPSIVAANITVKVFGSCLKSIQACILPQVAWQKRCLMPSLLFFSTFLCLPHTRAHTHTRTPSISLSCVWRSVKSHLSSWKGTGSTKFPFLHVKPSRHRMEWRSMARHVWSPHEPDCICMAPRRFTESTHWPYRGPLVTAL